MFKQMLKSSAIWVIIGLSFSSLAKAQVIGAQVIGKDAHEIYDALSLEEVREYPGRMGVLMFHKSVGGLECTRIKLVYPGAESRYSCELNATKNDREIYDSLSVEEVSLDPDNLMELNELKSVGGLDCEKTQAKHPFAKPHYECSLD